jgi:dienelactone hydrolase
VTRYPTRRSCPAFKHESGIFGLFLGRLHFPASSRNSNDACRVFAPELAEFGGLGSAVGPASYFQIHHGSADTLVPYSNSLTIKAALEREGNVPQLCCYDGAGHGFLGDSSNATARTSLKARTFAFFEAHL